MDSQEYYDNKLTTIKVFNSYLSNIINKGYNNDIDTLLLIVKNIDNFVDEQIEANKYYTLPKELLPSEPTFLDENESDNNISSNSDIMNSDTESETESDEDIIKSQKDKELNKIKNFIENSNNLSKVYIYKKNNNYITKMKIFINESFKY